MPSDRALGHLFGALVVRADRRGRLRLLSLALALLVAPHIAHAQQPKKMPRIGVLSPFSPTFGSALVEVFRQGLRDLRYVEGQNITFEYRWAEGKYDRLPSLAAELVRLDVDIIVATATPAIQAAQQATSTISIVMAISNDPVESGFVASLARPGGNVTGLSLQSQELSGKRLELLKEAIPKLSRVAVLWNASNPSHTLLRRETEAAARALGLRLQLLEVRGPTEFDGAFSAMTRDRARALAMLPDGFFRDQQRRILDLAAKSRLPAMYWSREFVDAGGLMAYGANIPDLFRRAATFVDKILKGAKPADLPVEQPTRFDLVLNLKTAKALGLTFPQSILIRADQVIR